MKNLSFRAKLILGMGLISIMFSVLLYLLLNANDEPWSEIPGWIFALIGVSPVLITSILQIKKFGSVKRWEDNFAKFYPLVVSLITFCLIAIGCTSYYMTVNSCRWISESGQHIFYYCDHLEGDTPEKIDVYHVSYYRRFHIGWAGDNNKNEIVQTILPEVHTFSASGLYFSSHPVSARIVSKTILIKFRDRETVKVPFTGGAR